MDERAISERCLAEGDDEVTHHKTFHDFDLVVFGGSGAHGDTVGGVAAHHKDVGAGVVEQQRTPGDEGNARAGPGS